MERVEKTVFISYRRVNLPWALSIFQNLTQHGYDVFIDFNGLASGDFERVILANIRARAHFVVLLTPSALEGCDDPDDWLRLEIEAALDNKRNIVPLMLEGFDFKTLKIANQLQGKLAALKHYSALPMPPPDYFDDAMDRLRSRYLNVPLNAVLHPMSRTALQAATKQTAAAHAAPMVPQLELTAQQWYERAVAASDNHEKIRLYNEAIRLKPDDAKALNNRGVALRDTGDLDRAVEDFDEAIRLNPDDGKAFNNRGNARADAGNNEAAIMDYDEAIRLEPDYALAFYNRGLVRIAIGDNEGAIEDCSEAIRLKPSYGLALHNRGVARSFVGDNEGAIEDYSEVIRLEPNNAEAFSNRGVARNDLAGC